MTMTIGRAAAVCCRLCLHATSAKALGTSCSCVAAAHGAILTTTLPVVRPPSSMAMASAALSKPSNTFTTWMGRWGK